MGVDAQMLVRTKRAVTPAEVKRIAVQMQIAFGHDGVLTVWSPNAAYVPYKGGRHCLEIIERYEQDGPAIKPRKGETLVEVSLGTRYYGPGYERGDLPGILAVARYLRAAFKPCEVWYGGDSSGICAEHLNDELESSLWEHFCSQASREYFSSGSKTSAVRCDFCDIPANNNMWGGGKTGHYCPSCGAHWLLYTDGRLVSADKDYKPLAVQP
jgi:hypothetical protein